MAVPTIGIAKGALMGMAELKTELQDRANFVVGSVSSPEDVARLTKSADALVVSLQRMTWAHIAALGPFVRVIGRAGVGLDNIDLEAARQKRMAVVHQPYYATHEVADHAAAMMLAAHRRLAQADEAIRVHGWPAAHTLGSIPALGELSLGILGCGRIGQMVSERMRPFVQRIYALDDRPDLVVDDITMTASLEELLRVSNILSLHLPLTADTKTYHRSTGAQFGASRCVARKRIPRRARRRRRSSSVLDARQFTCSCPGCLSRRAAVFAVSAPTRAESPALTARGLVLGKFGSQAHTVDRRGHLAVPGM